MKAMLIKVDDLPDDPDDSLVISFREAVYYSRRLQMLQRGLPFLWACRRASKLANYMVRRCGREKGW